MEATETPATVAKFTLPNLTGEREFDCAGIPGETRLDLLKSAVRGYIANRVNAAQQRHAKDETVKAWLAYEEASKADPLQSTVAKPEGDKPAGPDLEDAYNRAVADLLAGNIRKQGTGEKKPRERKDPLVTAVTQVVVQEVYESRRAADPKYSYLLARKEVGGDGIAYLNAKIETLVEQGADRTALEKMRDTKYINPAKVMLGITENKALKELPSIL